MVTRPHVAAMRTSDLARKILKCMHLHAVKTEPDIITRFSSFTKLVRVAVWYIRALYKRCHRNRLNFKLRLLSGKELSRTEFT